MRGDYLEQIALELYNDHNPAGIIITLLKFVFSSLPNIFLKTLKKMSKI